MYVCIVCMLFPLTNFSPWIWSLTGWVGKFKTDKAYLGWVEWLGSYVTGEEFESKCQVVAVEYTWLFQVWRRNISIPEKPVYSVWKYLTLPGSNSTSRPGKFQNPHPTKARFKFCTFRRTFVSNSLHPSLLRQSNTRGLPGGRWEGKKGGGGDDSSNRWAHYCAHSNDLKQSNV